MIGMSHDRKRPDDGVRSDVTEARQNVTAAGRGAPMATPALDPEVDAAIVFAEMIARSHAGQGGDIVDLFATFVGMVVQEDDAIGLHCLGAVDQWFSGRGAPCAADAGRRS
jgi:hypothetical protein